MIKTTGKDDKPRISLRTQASADKLKGTVTGNKLKRPASASNSKKKPETPNGKTIKIPFYSKAGNETPKQTKQTQMHYQPRQHSQNPKSKADTGPTSTPKAGKQKPLWNNSPQKVSNPSLKKASLLYNNLIKTKYEKAHALIINSQERGNSKPSIMASSLGFKNAEYNHNGGAKIIKQNNLNETCKWNDKQRVELNLNSPKNPQPVVNNGKLNTVNLISGNPHNRLLSKPSTLIKGKQAAFGKFTKFNAPESKIGDKYSKPGSKFTMLLMESNKNINTNNIPVRPGTGNRREKQDQNGLQIGISSH